MDIQVRWQSSLLIIWSARSCDVGDLRQFIVSATGDELLASAAQLGADGASLKLSAGESFDLLIACATAPQESLSDSVRFWARLARLVRDKLAAQQFFPTAVALQNRLHATWRPLINRREELEALERFSAAMPRCCREGNDGPATGALDTVEDFLAATADAIIRRALSSDPFFTRVNALSREPDAPPEVRWLGALVGESREVHGSREQLDSLHAQVRSWTGRLDDPQVSVRWKLGFELEEPADDESCAWIVSMRLRPSDGDGDPIDAETIIRDSQASSGALARNIVERRNQFEEELKRAAPLFPALAAAMQSGLPHELSLDTATAHQFIRSAAIDLRAAGFAVELPEWTDTLARSLGLILSLRPGDSDDLDDLDDLRKPRRDGGAFSPATSRVGLDTLLNFDWKMSVGGHELSPQEFESLVRQHSPLVKLRGQWVEIDAQAARSAAQFLQDRKPGKITLAEALRAASGAGSELTDVPILSITGTDWIQQLLDQSPSSRLKQLPQPDSFVGQLRPYQLRGLQWLVFLDELGIGSCLADDMGLGKTIQLIALLLHERHGNGDGAVGPTLLFAPTSVLGNWMKELSRFSPSLKTMLHHGNDRLGGDAFVSEARKHDVVVTGYSLASRDVDDLKAVPWRRIVLDEAQKIKNPSAASSTAIRTILAPRRVALTGTPIENHLAELWSIMDTLNPGLLGSARDFREKFAVPIERMNDPQRAAHLKQMIRPFILRRIKNDPEIAPDLPEKMEMKVYCPLTVEQAALYQRITSEMLNQIDHATGIRRRGLILAVLTRLKQICDHPKLVSDDDASLDSRSGKCERLVEMLEEVIEENEKALVFTQYKEMGDLLEKLLPARLGKPVLYLHGGTPQKKRDEIVKQFQTPGGEEPVFILSLRAGGLGLNLTAASHVFHFDRWWNPAVENQATDRAHRIGQSKRVQVHKFISLGTVEERIDKMLTDKTALAETIVGTGEEWLTNLSTAELKEYLALSEQAVTEF